MLDQKVLTACSLELCLDSDLRKVMCEVSNYGERGSEKVLFLFYCICSKLQIAGVPPIRINKFVSW